MLRACDRGERACVHACKCARECGSISLHYSPPVSYRLKKMLNDVVVL